MNRNFESVSWLVLIGWVVFMASLLMPVLRVQVPEILGFEVRFDETYSGWHAATTGLHALGGLADDPGALLMALAGLGNLVLLLSPLCVASRRRLPGYLVGAFMIIAVVSGLFVVLQFGVHAVRVGCLAWVLSYMLVIAGLLAQGKRPTSAVA